MVTTILIVSGILALIALAAPGSIILGLFLGVLPGLILSVAPGVFAYTAAFAIIRNLIPFGSAGVRGLIAAVLALALGYVIALPAALRGKQAYQQALKEDVAPSLPIALKGHVLVKAAARSTRKDPALGYVPECDGLCAALLDTPGVRSVTIEPADPKKHRAVTYALVDKSDAPAGTVVPVRPESILDDLPEDPAQQSAPAGDLLKRAENARVWREAHASSWALRTATRESITAAPARGIYDQTIAIKDIRRAPGPGKLGIAELEVSEADRILYRRQHLVGHPIAAPLFPFPDINGMTTAWDFGRSTLRKGPKYGELRPVRLLFENSNLARPEAPKDETGAVREALAAAIRNPGLSPDADVFKLVQPWLKTLKWADLGDEEIELLAAAIADPRIVELRGVHEAAPHAGPQLRHAIARRLLDPSTSNVVRNELDSVIRAMPKGTFATLTEDERAIVSRQALRLKAPAYVERLADQGEPAVPALIRILQADVQGTQWHERWPEMAAIRRALIRLGPKASSALPVVHRLFVTKPSSPIMNSSGDAQDWRVAMVRMGLPPGDLPFPDHLREELRARDREWIVKQAAKAAAESDGSRS